MEKKKKEIWIFAGEDSGDLYGSNIATELKRVAGESVHIAGMGGERMKKAGVDIIVDSSDLGVMGFIEVLKMIKTFKKVFHYLLDEAKTRKPDLIVMIDYPGFNLRFAKKAHQLGIPIAWYISPQVWAWKKGRIPTLAKVVKKMMCIFPFEVDVYKGSGLDAEFVGHPLVSEIRKQLNPEIVRDDDLILLLPGSRKNEIEKMLPVMIESANKLFAENSSLKFVISAPRENILQLINDELSKLEVAQGLTLELNVGRTREYMQRATAGIATSGTVTVECAISSLPITVVYKINPITCFLAKLFVKLEYFTMVNILGKKEIYQEFLQGEANQENVVAALKRILPGGDRRESVLLDINDVVEGLSGGTESSNKRAAEICLELVEL
jgi:lipid-A-disaccharide synthase